ncbi:unnamed protein product [Arabis nemorensis]|uniref:Uncharacterized protein n=1 Tax=Arabis nemorensis TaxID=586526 RepID=A0A565CHU3_9BRAS|nr:unnamed protein product [Arabis nemorensis]
MASKCIDDCLNINSEAVCVRPGTTYAKLYKWPVAEVEFVRSISNGGSQRSAMVNSISCRQIYLRSYTFSRKEENEYKREGQDGEDAGDRSIKRRCFGGRRGRNKAAKNGTKTRKTVSHRAYVVRLVRKCLSCVSSAMFNIEK